MIIRINLHPAKKVKAKSNPSTGILVVCILIAVAVFAVFFFLASQIDEQTKAKQAQAQKVQVEIDAVKERIKDIAQIRANVTELENRSRVIGKLASNRQGPQYVLNELSRIMSNPKDVVSRKEANELGWLVAWEPDNVIIKSFKDIGNGMISLSGIARSMDDIQELWTRMKTSTMLRNIKLIEIKSSRDSAVDEPIQSFVFEAEANFNYRTKEGRALVEKLTKDADDGSDKPAEGASDAAAVKQ